ncbi:MAG: NnrS family protein [Alphaproteobacteria bacterium]|nr:NnrS family protein [Alphaproteobacteria bacterium]
MIFAFGFRTFFLLAGLSATLLVPLWMAFLLGYLEAPGYLGPIGWHAHEMIFGYALAVVAGFLLTSVAAWTNEDRVHGLPLALLAALWLSGRLAMGFADWLPGVLVAVLDLAFLPALVLSILPPLLRSRKFANTAFVVLLVLLLMANLGIHLEALGIISVDASRFIRVAVDLVVLFVILVGGRITPAFTRNALKVEITSRPTLDRLAIGLVVALLAADTVPGAETVAALLALAAALVNGLRLAGWQGLATRHSPILWVLHLGYAWVVVGLALKGLAGLLPALPEVAALHGLTLGAVGIFTLGMMSRVALGHTGRPLVITPSITAAYVLVNLAALARLADPLLAAVADQLGSAAAGLMWTLGFLIFLINYLPILTSPRADGRPG